MWYLVTEALGNNRIYMGSVALISYKPNESTVWRICPKPLGPGDLVNSSIESKTSEVKKKKLYFELVRPHLNILFTISNHTYRPEQKAGACPGKTIQDWEATNGSKPHHRTNWG